MNGRGGWEENGGSVPTERALELLNVIDQEGGNVSQRQLSKRLGIALGLVNSYLKRLIHKGYVKVASLPRNRLGYILTPNGISEKTRLAYEYASSSYRLYRSTREQCRALMSSLAEQGTTHVVLYGNGDVVEIAYLTLQESKLKLVAVVNGESHGKKFFSLQVQNLKALKGLDYQKLLVATLEPPEKVKSTLERAGIDLEHVCWL